MAGDLFWCLFGSEGQSEALYLAVDCGYPCFESESGADRQLCRDRFTGTPAVAVPLSHIKILLSKSRTMTANEFLLLKMKLPDRMGGNGAAFVQIIWVCRGGW